MMGAQLVRKKQGFLVCACKGLILANQAPANADKDAHGT
jgi:hypothetical protein